MSAITSVRLKIKEKLKTDPAYRTKFFRRTAQDEIALQIRQLRKMRDLKQKGLAQKAGMKQSAISRIEQAEYEAWTFKTLFRIAEALDARLDITFKPLEKVLPEYEEQTSDVERYTLAR
jgi:transcriptional regulator with XRE-family HTH domain